MTRTISKSMRFLALTCALLMLLLLFVGCGYTQDEGSEEELRTVGKVGEYNVPYEELYYWTMTAKKVLQAEYGEGIFDTEASRALYREELRELVYQNITAQYAVMELADEVGYTEKDVQDLVDFELTAMVESLGGMHEYRKMLHENYLTDHFMRRTCAVSILESHVFQSYVDYLGMIESDAEEICSVIMQGNTYIRTRHIAIFKNNGKSDSENRAQIEMLKRELDSGADFDTLVDTYNEDESQDSNGYYFMKGEMQESYEIAAFALSVGETSDIVETEDGYFIIRRFEKQKEYVLMNCYGEGSSLYDGYQKYTFLAMVDERQDELAFYPNTYGKSIDLTTLEAGIFFDLSYFFIVLGYILIACCVVMLIVWWCIVSIRADKKEKKKVKRARR